LNALDQAGARGYCQYGNTLRQACVAPHSADRMALVARLETMDDDQLRAWMAEQSALRACVEEPPNPARLLGTLYRRLGRADDAERVDPAPEPEADDAAGIDWADIERRIASMTPDAIERAYAQERHNPEMLWERHEARTWHASHEPTTVHDAVREQTKRDQEQARCRAKWSRLVEAGDYAALAKERAILRNTVKGRPGAHTWADWRIRELNELLAQQPTSPPLTSPPAFRPPPASVGGPQQASLFGGMP
jgi:hypothetical protein